MVNVEKFRQYLKENTTKGGQFVGMSYRKPLKGNRDNKEREIYCLQEWSSIYAGGNYEDKVNSHLKAEGLPQDFVAGATYGTHETPVLVDYGEVSYMQVQILGNSVCKSRYFLDGVECKKEDLVDIVPPSTLNPKKSTSKKQEEHGLNEDNAVNVQRFRLDRIVQVRIGGLVF